MSNSHKIMEKFSWMAAPDFQIVDTGKHTVTIKGVAARGNQISRNNRKYVDEELVRGARTFNGVPVTINHAPYKHTHPMYDSRKVVGHVDWMEYEDDRLEYRAEIKKQPYVDLIRNKSLEIRGVSIEADYLFNRCSHCGKDFYDVASFEHHMVNEEFIKNFHWEPRGIVGRALSLVVSPEEPGIPDTTIELAETLGFSQLLETVIKKNKEIEEMKQTMGDKAVITPITRITPDRARSINEAEESQVVSDAAAVDPQSNQNPPIHPVLPVSTQTPEEEQAETKPISPTPNPEQPETKVTEQEEEPLSCPEGFHPNEDGSACVADEESPAEETVAENPESEQPVPHPVPEPHVASNPEEEQADTIPEGASVSAPPEVKVMEIKLPKLLSTKKPESFDEQIKEMYNPELAYKRGLTQTDTINQLIEAVATLALTNPKQLQKLTEYIQTSTRAAQVSTDKKFKAIESIIKNVDTKHVNLLATKLKESADKASKFETKTAKTLNNLATEIAKRDTTNKLNALNLVVANGLHKLATYESLTPQIATIEKSISEIKEQLTDKEEITQLQEQIKALQTMKETFEKLLTEADKNAEARDEKIKSLEERLAESEKQKVKESTDRLTEMQNKIDNLANKLEPQFKAKSQRVVAETQDSDAPYVPDPNTGGR